ncbi:hypothetical protein FRC06_010477 [Ceratobasidium sp. 370]|nr:hypothetical protein FRC06_010477 [Ceratobasidium sp. 370]
MAESLLSNENLLRRTLAAIATTFDAATQVLLLASSTASRHVTGTNIILAGGLDGRVLPEPVDLV